MKKITLFIVLISTIGIGSCDKDDSEIVNSPVAEKYIEQLKSNSYDSGNLPALTYIDISTLLKCRNETMAITHFPHPPFSSYLLIECKLGMYILWTIESIRSVAIDSVLIMRFPSHNPILALRDDPELDLVFDDHSHEVAAEVYYKWWENNKDKNFEDFADIDPLEGTDYRWH